MAAQWGRPDCIPGVGPWAVLYACPPPSSSVPFLTWLAIAAAQGRGETYVVGIVDVLQEFTCLKAAECAAKQILAGLRGGHPNCMSIVPPSAYASRLRHYISQNTE